MENVVYLLGAGFSAELGIPVVSNFLEEARDLYRLDHQRFAHFAPVFDRLQRLGHVKNYMRFDLDNVEEVLSLLQMEAAATGAAERQEFARFICDVVNAKTPPLPSKNVGEDIYYGFETMRPWRIYLWFVGSLLGIGVGYPERGGRLHRLPATPVIDARYTIVTLNYDRAIELAAEALATLPLHGTEPKAPSRPVPLKLHGCVSDGAIVAPTANKAILSGVQPAWDAAFKALREATQIRFIGYSLPETDVYVRYLLGSALSQALNIKRIDVLCLDRKGVVKSRYEALFEGRRLRFAGNIETGAYMSQMWSAGTAEQVVENPGDGRSRRIWWKPGSIEAAHQVVFRSYSRDHE